MAGAMENSGGRGPDGFRMVGMIGWRMSGACLPLETYPFPYGFPMYSSTDRAHNGPGFPFVFLSYYLWHADNSCPYSVHHLKSI